MPPKLLKNGTVLTFDDTTQTIRALPSASILIVDDRIAAISPSSEDNDPPTTMPPDTEFLPMHGKILSPGFVNTHIHTWRSTSSG